MSNYTTKTAALKATKIDTRKLDTNKLFINGELFDPSKIKESPNEAKFQLMIAPLPDVEEKGYYISQSLKSNQDGESMFRMEGVLLKGSEEDVLPNGVYAGIEINDDFVKCFSGYILDDIDEVSLYNISLAKFEIATLTEHDSVRIGQCILENFITANGAGHPIWVIKICEEDDNLSELYGGIPEENPYFVFLVSIPYYIPENDTSSSTYSLRKTNPFDGLREKFEQMRQQRMEH